MMAKTVSIEILGKPIAKERPKFFRKGHCVGTYDPQDIAKVIITIRKITEVKE
jgi:hypothetical protein